VQKLSGDAAVALRPARLHDQGRSKAHAKPAGQTQHSFLFQTSYFATQGNQGSRQKTAKITDCLIVRSLITAHRKSTEWSALEKPVAPLTESAACRKKHLLELAKGFEPPTL
jgi:hypothetical protein